MSVMTHLRTKPWLPFLGLALVMQQGNLLTYKFGGQMAPPEAFLVYSFLVQCVVNLIMAIFFKSRGFPLVLKGKMRIWALWICFLYVINETVLMYVFKIGAPYSLMMTVYALCMMTILTTIGVLFIKEKISPKQIVGIFTAMAAICLVRMG